MLGFGDASAICGVYGTYVDPMSGEVTSFNGGCTDPTTASQLSTVALLHLRLVGLILAHGGVDLALLNS